MSRIGVLCADKSGLETWNRVGSLSRETALYQKLIEAEWGVSFFTYDQHRNLPDSGLKAEIYPQWPVVLPKKLQNLYYHILPLRYRRPGQNIDILMTDQAHGATPAVRAARLWKTKLVARCGYVYGECAEKLNKTGKKVRNRMSQEKWTFQNADQCVVPTAELKKWIVTNYEIDEGKIEVIPNYVDTSRFKPIGDVQQEYDVICIGRLVEEKRHHKLIEALANTDCKVLIIGSGRWKEKLEELAEAYDVNLTMVPRVEHWRLPEYLNRAKVYVNLSRWEGHPKAMIEAMACGLPVVGAKSPGIQNLVTDREIGTLIDPTPEKVAEELHKLLAEENHLRQLGENAERLAQKKFSLEQISKKYLNLFTKLGVS